MKVGIFYNTIDQPWGGINTFFRNFIQHAKKDKAVEIVSDLSEADLILTAGHYQGPGKLINSVHLRNISNSRSLKNPLGLFPFTGTKKIVFRIDGLRLDYDGKISDTDNLLINNLSYASGVVFQSKYSKNRFEDLNGQFSYETDIVHNGADSLLFFPSVEVAKFADGVRLISNSWSINENKGFRTIAAFSELENVFVSHIGRWPSEISSNVVCMLGEMSQKEIAVELRKHHFLLFPSEDEACSNTVTEALSSGLPVLYHPSGGTIEQCRYETFGVQLPICSSGFNNAILENIICTAIEHYSRLRNNVLKNIDVFSFSFCYDNYIRYFSKVLS